MSTKKLAVLLADDDPVMLKLLSQVINSESYRVVPARDSATVLKLVT